MDTHKNTPKLLFLAVLCLQIAYFAYLILNFRAPGGHDGFEYFILQYYFLNNVVNTGEIPQWIPYLTHGTFSNWWYPMQGGILQSILLVSHATFLKSVNFFYIFYAGMFLQELALITGVWLLARRFFSSPLTAFVLTISLLSSTVWFSQPCLNFHFYYLLPLVLHFIHAFFDKGRLRYLLISANLLFFQFLGNAPYFFPLLTLVVFFYTLTFFVFNHQECWDKLQRLNMTKTFLCLIIAAINLSIFSLYYSCGTGQIVSHIPHRNMDGSASLQTFLTYAGNLNMNKWFELICGVSPAVDYSLYLGLLTFPLIILGAVFSLNKRYAHFLLTTVMLFAFISATPFSTLLYYTWPMMKFYRHLSLAAPLIKVFLVFLAGIGWETYLNSLKQEGRLNFNLTFFMISLLILANGWMVCTAQGGTYFFIKHVIEFDHALNVLPGVLKTSFLVQRLARTLSYSCSLMILLFLLTAFRKKYLSFFILSLLLLHIADTFSYRLIEASARTFTVPVPHRSFFRFYAPAYVARRNSVADINKNPRMDILNDLKIPGALYWSTDAFLFNDRTGSPFRTDHWLKPFDDLVKTADHKPLDTNPFKPSGLIFYNRFHFPPLSNGMKSVMGVNEDKIQFFLNPDFLKDAGVAQKMQAADFDGGLLITAPRAAADTGAAPSQRLRLSYAVTRFDANHAEFIVDTGRRHDVWAFYSDTWHPFWECTVNGKPTAVYKADLAYKAVRLGPGTNIVHFYFFSGFLIFCYYFFGLNALGVMGLILFNLGRILRGESLSGRL